MSNIEYPASFKLLHMGDIQQVHVDPFRLSLGFSMIFSTHKNANDAIIILLENTYMETPAITHVCYRAIWRSPILTCVWEHYGG